MLKKILFIHHNCSLVGSSNSLYLLVKELDRNRFEPVVLITAPKGPLYDTLSALNVEVHFISGVVSYGHGNGARPMFWAYPPFRNITFLFKIPRSIALIRSFLLKHPVDLVYINTSVLWAAAVAGKRLGIKTLIHVREQISNVGWFGVRKTLFRKLLERYSDKLIVLTKASKAQYQKKDKISVIYNAVDRLNYQTNLPSKNVLRKKLGLQDEGKVIIYLGGALRHKGFEILLKAFKKINQTNQKVYLLVLGNTESPYLPTKSIAKKILRTIFLDDTAKEFQNLLVEKEFKENIIQVGAQKNVHEYLSVSDVLIFPSTLDHFGRPIIEALALGIPIIASNHPSNIELKQIFQESGYCSLFENQNETELFETIEKVLSSEKKNLSIHKIPSIFNQQGFYSDIYAKKVISVMEDLV